MSGYGAPVRILAPPELAGKTGRIHRDPGPLGSVIVRMDYRIDRDEFKVFLPREIERITEEEEAWVK